MYTGIFFGAIRKPLKLEKEYHIKIGQNFVGVNIVFFDIYARNSTCAHLSALCACYLLRLNKQKNQSMQKCLLLSLNSYEHHLWLLKSLWLTWFTKSASLP